MKHVVSYIWKSASLWAILAWLGLGFGSQYLYAASIEFVDAAHDFGNVFQGEVVEAEFVFKNKGDGDLKIHGVHAGCGCAVIDLERTEYPENSSGTIKVRFDTRNFTGRVVKTITVNTNDRKKTDRLLTIKANIEPEFIVEPPVFDFGEVGSEDAVATVRIKSVKGVFLDLASIQADKKLFVVSVQENGDGALLSLKLNRKQFKSGLIKNQITLTTSSKNIPKLVVPVRGNVTSPFIISPEYVEFGAIEAGAIAERSVELKTTQDIKPDDFRTEFWVNGKKTKIDASNLFSLKVLQHQQDKKLVALSLKHVESAKGSIHGKLYLKVKSSKSIEVPLDFYAFFK